MTGFFQILSNSLVTNHPAIRLYTECPRRKGQWEVIVSVILSKKVYKYMFPVPNGYEDLCLLRYNTL
jgi:hypothetical protein